ncbi:hypothetical protein GGG16DRAFT_106981 [Schizophyllum commune]
MGGTYQARLWGMGGATARVRAAVTKGIDMPAFLGALGAPGRFACEARHQRERGALIEVRCRVTADRVTEGGGDVGGGGGGGGSGGGGGGSGGNGNGDGDSGGSEGSGDDDGERKSEVRRRGRRTEGELRENLRGSDGIGPDTWPVRSGRAPRRLRVALLLRPSFSPPPPLALSAVGALALAAAPAPVAVASLALVAVAAAAAAAAVVVFAADIAAAFRHARGNGALPRLDQRALPALSLHQACRLDAPHTLGNTNRHAKHRSSRAYRLRGHVRRSHFCARLSSDFAHHQVTPPPIHVCNLRIPDIFNWVKSS